MELLIGTTLFFMTFGAAIWALLEERRNPERSEQLGPLWCVIFTMNIITGLLMREWIITALGAICLLLELRRWWRKRDKKQSRTY